MTIEHPDFDSYPIHHQIAAANLCAGGVQVTWSDGRIDEYHRYMLRESAPDAQTTHPLTREQALQLLEIPEDLAAVAAAVTSAGTLAVTWQDHSTSEFHPGWLRAFGVPRDASEDPFALPKVQPWDQSLNALPRVDGTDLANRPEQVDQWVHDLHVYGVTVVTNVGTATDVVEQLPALIGPIRDTNFGYTFDVRSGAADTSNAYTAMALPVHTDLATREYKPGLQFLHCIRNSAIGGENQLADGFCLAARLRDLRPDHYETLTTEPLHFANTAIDTDYRWYKPMIGLNAAGDIDEVRWSPWLRGPLRGSIQHLDRIYAALRYVFELAQDPTLYMQVKLEPGEMLAFDNRRVLHGRSAFDPGSGDRWLRGCYGEREELQSRLRIAARRRRAREIEALAT